MFVVSCDARPRRATIFIAYIDPHHRPVNDLSTAVKLTNRLLRFWADGVFATTKESAVRLFSSGPNSLLLHNVVVCNRAG